MLKGLSPLLHADLLHTLASMGHGDFLMLVDANFPAHSIARHTVVGRPLMIASETSAQAAEAILSVMPLDSFVDAPAARMEVVGNYESIPEVQQEMQAVIDAAEGKSLPMSAIERFDYYERAKQAYAIVVAGERRFYGCFMLMKGVIGPDEKS